MNLASRSSTTVERDQIQYSRKKPLIHLSHPSQQSPRSASRRRLEESQMELETEFSPTSFGTAQLSIFVVSACCSNESQTFSKPARPWSLP